MTLARKIHAACVVGSVFALLGCQVGSSQKKEFHVFAASSLTEVFREFEKGFEQKHPDINVRLNLGGSQVLALQIEQGAPAGMFVSADGRHVQRLAHHGLLSQTAPFAETRLVLAVLASSPVQTFEQLPRVERLVVGSPSAPIGLYTESLLSAAQKKYGATFVAQVRNRIVSRESNVRLVRTKLALGEADAAILYSTDLPGMPGVRAIRIPTDLPVRTRYFVAFAPGSEVANKMRDYLATEPARRALKDFGFEESRP